jgi:hypothetical protein
VPRTRLALVVCILTALPAGSQAQGTGAALGPRQPAFQALEDSQWVRLSSPTLGRRQGLERSSNELVLSSQSQPLRVPATTIDTLWRRGTSIKTGAIAGALIGGALGVGLGVACGELGEDCNTGEAIALFGGLGMGGGGILGALVEPSRGGNASTRDPWAPSLTIV